MRLVLPLAVLLSSLFLGLYAAAQRPSPAARHKSASASSKSTNEIKKGEELFQIHCGRCHNPPEDLSSREARAVVRQMRVRAMLSDADERSLLKFLAP